MIDRKKMKLKFNGILFNADRLTATLDEYIYGTDSCYLWRKFYTSRRVCRLSYHEVISVFFACQVNNGSFHCWRSLLSISIIKSLKVKTFFVRQKYATFHLSRPIRLWNFLIIRINIIVLFIHNTVSSLSSVCVHQVEIFSSHSSTWLRICQWNTVLGVLIIQTCGQLLMFGAHTFTLPLFNGLCLRYQPIFCY